jgi:hypothetical protein
MLALQEGSSMKKLATLTALSLLAMLIVLPVIHSVNLLAGKPTAFVPTLRADGWPLPFPVPHGNSLTV